MKPNTMVWIGIRNVGSSEEPQLMSGSVSESFIWLAQQIGQVYMKNGLKIFIGRSKDEVLSGLDLKRGLSTAKSMQLQDMLTRAMSNLESDVSADVTELGAESNDSYTPYERHPDDTYQG